MSPSKTYRQAILDQKIEALLELAKLALVQAEGLKTRSIHTLIASDSPVVEEESLTPRRRSIRAVDQLLDELD